MNNWVYKLLIHPLQYVSLSSSTYLNRLTAIRRNHQFRRLRNNGNVLLASVVELDVEVSLSLDLILHSWRLRCLLDFFVVRHRIYLKLALTIL